MSKYIVNVETGNSLLVTPENMDRVKVEYQKNPDLYRLEEDESLKDIQATQKQDMDAEIKAAQQAQMAEDEAQEPLLKRMAKNAIRTVLPYSAEEMEQTGRVTNTGGLWRDVVNLGTTFSPAKIPALIAGGAVRTVNDIGAQLDNDGELDAERTAWTAGLNVGLPAGVGAAKKPIEKVGGYAKKAGEYVKDRASRQLYGSFVPKALHSQGKNPITPKILEQEFLAKGNIPIFTTEAKAFEAMQDVNLENLMRKSQFRDNLARDITAQVPIFKQVTPAKTHFEVAPSDEIIAATKAAESKELSSNLGKKGAYVKAMNKWERDPYATFMEKPEAPIPTSIPIDKNIEPWQLLEIVDEPQVVSRGAYEEARRAIAVKFKNDRVAGKKVIDNLDEWAQAHGLGKSKGLKNAYSASQMVTDLNNFAKTFAKTPGATTPYELSRSYMAQALNNQIGKVAPELRAASRDMAVNMAILNPLKDRIAKSTVQQPKSGWFAGLLETPKELSTTLHRRPQGAQLKYNMGRTFIEGSPMLKNAYKYGGYTLPSQMEDE